MSPSLSVVADNDLRVAGSPEVQLPKPETVAERVRRLQSEARQLANPLGRARKIMLADSAHQFHLSPSFEDGGIRRRKGGGERRGFRGSRGLHGRRIFELPDIVGQKIVHP